jgi:hypothetical protein
MPPLCTPRPDCGRTFVSIRKRYENRVRNQKNRLRTAFSYRYENRVRSNSYYLRRLLPTLWQAFGTVPEPDAGAPAMGNRRASGQQHVGLTLREAARAEGRKGGGFRPPVRAASTLKPTQKGTRDVAHRSSAQAIADINARYKSDLNDELPTDL